MDANRRELLERLNQILGSVGVVQEPAELATYGADRCRGPWVQAPWAVVFPRTVAQVQDIVRACAHHGVPIVPSGGRTGLVGGATAVAQELVVSLTRMGRILWVEPGARMIACEAGATVEAVAQAAGEVGLMYPVDFAAKGSAQIGGSIATNAGGVKVLRYGSTRAWVNGLKVVVASGEVLDLGGSLVKDNTGYDLRQLFIGAEGTLGIVVEAVLRLTAPPANLAVALCAVPDDASILRLFDRLQRAVTLQAFECFDHPCLSSVLQHRGQVGGPFDGPSHAYVLVEVEHPVPGDTGAQEARRLLTEAIELAAGAGDVEDAVVATTGEQSKGLWALREDISESLHRHRPHKNDVSLPVPRIPQFVADWRRLVAELLPEARPLVFGHVGDGNLHLNVVPAPGQSQAEFLARCGEYDAQTYALIEAAGGSISAEHGVGLLKREHLHFSRSPAELVAMAAIKRALDPDGLFNPGKILPG